MSSFIGSSSVGEVTDLPRLRSRNGRGGKKPQPEDSWKKITLHSNKYSCASPKWEPLQKVASANWARDFEPHGPVAGLRHELEAEEGAAPMLGIDHGGKRQHEVACGLEAPACTIGKGLGTLRPSDEAWQEGIAAPREFAWIQCARDGTIGHAET
jgi:hypothetical protein